MPPKRLTLFCGVQMSNYPSDYQRGYNDARRDARTCMMSPGWDPEVYRRLPGLELVAACRKALLQAGHEETEEYWLGYEHGIGMVKKDTK